MQFAYKQRVRKPTQSKADCAARLMFMLDMDDYWHEGVHGFIDQGEFPIPLCQRVRPWGKESTGTLRATRLDCKKHETLYSPLEEA